MNVFKVTDHDYEINLHINLFVFSTTTKMATSFNARNIFLCKFVVSKHELFNYHQEKNGEQPWPLFYSRVVHCGLNYRSYTNCDLAKQAHSANVDF